MFISVYIIKNILKPKRLDFIVEKCIQEFNELALIVTFLNFGFEGAFFWGDYSTVYKNNVI